MTIEKVLPEDAAELLQIYAPYVQDTAISFEYEVPSEAEFRRRIEEVSAKFPYLKAVNEGKTVGYAYAHAYREREAYSRTVETSIYVRRDCRKAGVGRALYQALEASLKNLGVMSMIACVAAPQGEDAHLSKDSLKFHTKMGFEPVGTLHSCGYKFQKWYNIVFFEKLIGVQKCHEISGFSTETPLLKEL